MKSKIQYSIVLLLFLVSSMAKGQLNLADKLPLAPEIRKGVLPNGLTYYIRKNAKPENKVELRLAVKAGSILEDDDQLGLAHFTEHMAFNGSKHFKKNDLVSFLQSIGVQFGADLNASTGFDETTYILPIPVDKPENLDKGFLVLEDWASHVTFDPAEIDKERGVVLEEDRSGKGAQERMMKKALPLILEGSRYANRLPIGKPEILRTFKPETIKRFYHDWYRPDLMAVIVVGDLDPDKAEVMIKKHFEKFQNPVKEKIRSYAEVPSRTLSSGLVITDKEATNHILQIFYTTKKSKEMRTLGDYRESLVRALSSQMLSQRLQELTQKAEPPFVAGGSSRDEFVHGYESYYAAALIGKAGVKPAIAALIQENERARKFGFTAPELDRTKKSFARNIERAFNEREKTESESYVEEYLGNFFQSEPIPGIENEYKYYQQFLSDITLQEVNEFTGHNIPSSTENKLILFQGPETADFPIPTDAELLSLVKEAEKLQVTAYEEKSVATSLMASMPLGGKISEEKKNDALGYSDIMLSNGVRVILKPTDFKNDQVVFSGFRFGGQSLYGEKDAINAQYTSTVVSQMGVGPFSPVDLRKVLAGKTVSASPRLSGLSESIGGSSGSADIESMLQLVNLYFTSPRKDEELFKSFISKQESVVQNMMADPRAVFTDSVQRMMYNFHPRGPRYPRIKDFQQLDVDRVLQIYKERFGNAQGWTFIFAGSFDAEKIKPLITGYLGTLPSSSSGTPAFKDLGIRPVKGVVKKEIRKGKEAKSLISIAFSGEAPYSPKEQMTLQALIELMNIKLIETLREELSGIYGGGMSGGLNKNPYNNYTINISLPCGPENVIKLIDATFSEIQKVKDKGPLEADLNKVKETFSKQIKEDLKDNGYWVTRLQRAIEWGTSPEDILTTESRIKALTTHEIQLAAKKYFNMNNYFQAVLYPEP